MKGGYKGFYAHNTISLTPKGVNDIHKRGGNDTTKIVDSIQDQGINQVFISFYLQEHIISLSMYIKFRVITKSVAGLYNWRRWNSEGCM